MEEVGSSVPGCEIPSLLDKLLARWSTASCALALACWPSVSKKKEKRKEVKDGASYSSSVYAMLWLNVWHFIRDIRHPSRENYHDHEYHSMSFVLTRPLSSDFFCKLGQKALNIKRHVLIQPYTHPTNN